MLACYSRASASSILTFQLRGARAYRDIRQKSPLVCSWLKTLGTAWRLGPVKPSGQDKRSDGSMRTWLIRNRSCYFASSTSAPGTCRLLLMKQQGARPFTTRSLRLRAVLKNAHRLMLHSKELADPVQHHAAFLRGTCSKTSKIYLPVQI